MAWDKTLPNNATKIRNYPSVLTQNWEAIEEGDITLQQWQINLIERNAVPGPISSDPSREDDVMILYSKQDASAETESFILDDRNPANVIQITEDGYLGSLTQQVSASNVRFDAPIAPATYQAEYGINQMLTAYGRFNSAGTLASGFNMAGAAKAGNTYTVTVAADVLLNSNYILLLTSSTPDDSSERVINYISKGVPAAGVATTITLAITSGSGSSRSQAFQVVVIGGR